MEERKNEISDIENNKRKISVVAEIKRDVENCFFVVMLYEHKYSKLQTVYGIEDQIFLSEISKLSYDALNRNLPAVDKQKEIIVYDLKTKSCFSGNPANYTAKDRIIVGTTSRCGFSEINYMLERIDETLRENRNGEIYVQYKDKVMTVEEFKAFQDNLKVYNTV